MQGKVKKIACILGEGKISNILLKYLKKEEIETLPIYLNKKEELHTSSIMEKIKGWGAEEVIFCGSFSKHLLFKEPHISKDSLRKEGIFSFASFIKDLFEKEGIRVTPYKKYLKNLLCKEGVFTSLPSDEEMEDILWGMKLAKRISSFGIGHTVVVKNKVVLAIEAAEGTDEAILRGGAFAERAVVIKVGCKRLDWFDTPIVGKHTLYCMKKVRAGTIALEAGRVLVLDDFIPLAKSMQINVLGIKCV